MATGPNGTALLDDFNRADGAPGSNWTEAVNLYTVPDIASNQLSWPEFASAAWNTEFNADQEVWVTPVNTGNGLPEAGFLLRFTSLGTGTENGYELVANIDTEGDVTLYEWTNGTPTQLDFGNFVVPNGMTSLAASIVGSTITLYGSSDNGATWSSIKTWTDSTHTGSGYIGMYLANNTVTAAFDNFGGGNVISTTTYYIAADGDDTNDGLSTSTPWKTVAKVNTESTSGGQHGAGIQFLFKGGDTFLDGAGIAPWGGGVEGNPMVFGSYGTGKATIQEDPNAPFAGAFWYPDTYTTIQDLILTGPTDGTDTVNETTCIQLPNNAVGCEVLRCDISGWSNIGVQCAADDVVIDSNTISDCGSHCILSDQTGGGANIVISNNTISGWSMNAQWEAGGRHGIYFESAGGVVHGNTFSSPGASPGQGVSIRRAGQKVYNNTFHDVPFPMAFFNYEGNSVNNLTPGWTWVFNNRAWNITGYAFYMDGSAPDARVGGPGSYTNTVDLCVVNNTFHFAAGATDGGIINWSTSPNVDASSVFVNNIVIGAPVRYLNVADPTRSGKTLIEGANIFLGATGTPYKFGGTDYSTLAAYQTASSHGQEDVEADPLLSDNGPNMIPTSNSPAIAAGDASDPETTGLTYATTGSPDVLYTGSAPNIGAIQAILNTLFNPAVLGGAYF